MNTSRTALCGVCQAPLPDQGTLCAENCVEGLNGFRDCLERLTSRVIGGEKPRTKGSLKRVTIPAPGYGRSTAWDTPRGEAANYPRMLREATARQTRFAAETGTRTTGTGQPGLRVDHTAGDRLADMERLLAAIAVDVRKATGTYPPMVTWGGVARWVDGHMSRVRMMPSAPHHLRELRRVLKAAERHVDRPPSRLYLGSCYRDGNPCRGEYQAEEGDALTKCTGCGHEVSVKERRKELLDQAESMWLTAVDIERLTTALGDRIADSTVSSWHQRGLISGSRPWEKRRTVGGEPVRYLFGDVMARIEARGGKGRRTTTTAEEKAS